jgi:hypothetical protein
MIDHQITGVIYELIDPRNGMCRYVGQTLDVQQRRKSHTAQTPIFQNNEDLHRWKTELASLGLSPEFRVIEDGIQPETIDEQERFWCRDRADRGCRLLNRPVGRIRKCDLLGTPERNEFADRAREIRALLFSFSEEMRGKLPMGHAASRHLKRCIADLLDFIHSVTEQH